MRKVPAKMRISASTLPDLSTSIGYICSEIKITHQLLTDRDGNGYSFIEVPYDIY